MDVLLTTVLCSMCMPDVGGGQRGSDPGTKFKMVVSHLTGLGIEPRSSGRATCALYCWSISLALPFLFLTPSPSNSCGIFQITLKSLKRSGPGLHWNLFLTSRSLYPCHTNCSCLFSTCFYLCLCPCKTVSLHGWLMSFSSDSSSVVISEGFPERKCWEAGAFLVLFSAQSLNLESCLGLKACVNLLIIP